MVNQPINMGNKGNETIASITKRIEPALVLSLKSSLCDIFEFPTRLKLTRAFYPQRAFLNSFI